MKRHARKLLLFLLLGAIINVAVAWGCAYLDFPGSSTSKEIPRAGAEAIVFPNVILNDPEARVKQYHALGFRLTRVDTTEMGWHLAVERGWPALAFMGWVRTPVPGDQESEYAIHWIGAPIQGVRHLYVLPLRPLWPGFAINTIFYAAIVSMLFAVPGMIRRRVRRKRGQCAACRYSLRGTAGSVCPECGAIA